MIWQKLLLPTLLAVALQPASLSAQGNARPFAFGQAQQQIEASSVVQWSHTLSDSGLVFQAAVKRPWHLYDIDLPQGGPTSTEFVLEEIQGAQPRGSVRNLTTPVAYDDKVFGMTLRMHQDTAAFFLPLEVTDTEHLAIKGYIRFMVCNDETCLAPCNLDFRSGRESLLSDSDTAAETTAAVGGDISDRLSSQPQLWAPVIEELQAFGAQATGPDRSLWRLFALGFLGGLLALLTPCVWPIIPMTVSFFLKRTRSRRKAIQDALCYGASIVVIYLLMGLGITLIFGASALNNLATNALFNLLFFLLLVAFALSFFGLFDIVLPASWANKMDKRSDSTSGLVSIFFMAFTLVLVSFSCTGPIIGTLLVEAASQGSLTGPAVGMGGFALALALPFSLFAVFPNMMQSLPKSGGWLNSVKVVLGFFELAFSLKFLSVADLAYGWGILPRELFVALWIVIALCTGLYLLGVIRFPHDDKGKKRIKALPLTLALLCFGFAAYMVPGLLGAPLKSISAFAPPMSTQTIKLFGEQLEADFLDYEQGMAYAREHGKKVLVDFSGYGCVNCRKMENAVWQDPRVKDYIRGHYVLISLMVDDKTALPSPLIIEEYGQRRKLRTVGDKWSYLQRHKFGANAQPFYVIVDTDGRPLAPAFAFSENPDDFLKFLQMPQ
ncbi:MAG: thioredoxin family protein [Bacteroidales bacterium]|nr:thioredoxin family protein [Bacteroidales bacterium]